MLSRPANRQSNDIAGGFVPFVKDAIGKDNELLERVRSNCDLAMAARWFDENKPAAQLQIRRCLSKVTMTIHACPSPLKYTEQLGNRPRLSEESNRRFINLVGFRRTGMIQRPTVSGDRDFANDNEPLREAA
jgi:hypothetical protein